MLPLRDHLPTRRIPIINYTLIAANVSVFVLMMGQIGSGITPEAVIRRWALVPAGLLAHPEANGLTLLTHMFLHGSLGHIGGNMLFLWIFGDNVEDALGHARYVLFYLACGVLGALAQVAAGPHSHVPMLGASGAIAGVLAAYGFLFPRSPITVVNPIPFTWLIWGFTLSFPAWLVIAEFFGVNLWDALQTSGAGAGVAFMAHVGGFIAGAVLLRALRPGPDDARYDPGRGWVKDRVPRGRR